MKERLAEIEAILKESIRRRCDLTTPTMMALQAEADNLRESIEAKIANDAIYNRMEMARFLSEQLACDEAAHRRMFNGLSRQDIEDASAKAIDALVAEAKAFKASQEAM